MVCLGGEFNGWTLNAQGLRPSAPGYGSSGCVERFGVGFKSFAETVERKPGELGELLVILLDIIRWIFVLSLQILRFFQRSHNSSF